MKQWDHDIYQVFCQNHFALVVISCFFNLCFVQQLFNNQFMNQVHLV